MKPTHTQACLLFEAFRRNDMADPEEKAKPLGKRWLGLGTAAAYRPGIKAGLFRFHDGRTPPPRCMGWLCLTEKGIEAMESCSKEFERVLDGLKDDPRYARSDAAQYQLVGGLSRP